MKEDFLSLQKLLTQSYFGHIFSIEISKVILAVICLAQHFYCQNCLREI